MLGITVSKYIEMLIMADARKTSVFELLDGQHRRPRPFQGKLKLVKDPECDVTG